MKNFISFLLCSIAVQFLSAQVIFQENDTLEHKIYSDSPKHIVDKYLKSIKAKKIIFSETLPNYYKIQNKKGKWTLLNLDYDEEKAIHQKAYDEVFLPTAVEAASDIAIAKHKGKYGFLDLEIWKDKRQQPKFDYDSIVFQNKEDIEKINKENNKNVEKTSIGIINPLPYAEFAVQKKGLWGKLVKVEGGTLLLAEPFVYKASKDIPTTKWNGIYHLPYLEDLYHKHNIDLAHPVPEEIVFVTGRNNKTKKWGLYGGESSFKELIKPAYDSIKMHEYPMVYEVWNQQKVGFYNEDFKSIKPTQYDDFRYVNLDHTYACALKKDDYWQLFEAFDGKLLVEGKAKNIDALIELWLKR